MFYQPFTTLLECDQIFIDNIYIACGNFTSLLQAWITWWKAEFYLLTYLFVASSDEFCSVFI